VACEFNCTAAGPAGGGGGLRGVAGHRRHERRDETTRQNGVRHGIGDGTHEPVVTRDTGYLLSDPLTAIHRSPRLVNQGHSVTYGARTHPLAVREEHLRHRTGAAASQ